MYRMIPKQIKACVNPGPSWSWLYGSWIYNYLCNQCLSPLKLWVRTPFMARCTRYKIMWLARGRWFSPGTPVSFTNKTDRHDIAEMLLKVALNTINQTLCNFFFLKPCFSIYMHSRYIYSIPYLNKNSNHDIQLKIASLLSQAPSWPWSYGSWIYS
jgi:hypothetical protein